MLTVWATAEVSSLPAEAKHMPKAKPVSRNATNNWWCFTLNNYSEEDYEVVRALFHNKANRISYIVVGKELGENKTPHLQGFVAFSVRKQFATVKKLISERAHVEPMRSTPSKAAEYCKKDGDFFEKGLLPDEVKKQGARTDLSAIKEQLDAGRAVWEIAQATTDGFSAVSRAHKFFLGYETAIDTPRNFQTQVYVFYGSAGTFKSTAAHRFAQLFTVVRPRHAGDGVWFDGYQPNVHRAALLDDFYGWMPFNNLLELLDRYGCRVQVKGGTVQWKPHSVCITSNTSPERWYKYGEHMHYPALQRRLAHVFKYTSVEARDDARGLAVGDVTVSVDQGHIECHPLFANMTPAGEGVWKLVMEAELATQMEVDMQIEFTKAALGEATELQVNEDQSSPPEQVINLLSDDEYGDSHFSVSSDEKD